MQRTIENVGDDPTEGGLVLFGLRVHVKNVPLSVILVLRMNSTGTRTSGTREKACGAIVGEPSIELSLARLGNIILYYTSL